MNRISGCNRGVLHTQRIGNERMLYSNVLCFELLLTFHFFSFSLRSLTFYTDSSYLMTVHIMTVQSYGIHTTALSSNSTIINGCANPPWSHDHMTGGLALWLVMAFCDQMATIQNIFAGFWQKTPIQICFAITGFMIIQARKLLRSCGCHVLCPQCLTTLIPGCNYSRNSRISFKRGAVSLLHT